MERSKVQTVDAPVRRAAPRIMKIGKVGVSFSVPKGGAGRVVRRLDLQFLRGEQFLDFPADLLA